MRSLYDELAAKLALDPSLTKRGGPRLDIGLLLLGRREELNILWKAAAQCLSQIDQVDQPPAPLSAAVDDLRSAV